MPTPPPKRRTDLASGGGGRGERGPRWCWGRGAPGLECRGGWSVGVEGGTSSSAEGRQPGSVAGGRGRNGYFTHFFLISFFYILFLNFLVYISTR